MSYTSRTRNGYRVLVAAVTGALSLGSLTVTGLVAGQAAADHNDQLAAKALKEREAQEKYERDKAAYEAALAAAEPQVIWKKRPVKKSASRSAISRRAEAASVAAAASVPGAQAARVAAAIPAVAGAVPRPGPAPHPRRRLLPRRAAAPERRPVALPQAAEPGSLPSGHAFAATTFRALGTYIYVAVRDPRELSRAEQLSRDLLADIDETCSRFRDDSDLTLVNAHAGSWVAADPLLVAGVRVALDAANLTDWSVNPLVGKSLSFWGYDRDFESLVAQPTPVGAASETARDPDAWRRIELADDAVRIPAGTSLDLGATAKAWAADLIVRAWAEHLDHGALVSLGGDLAILGDGEPWPIAVSERPAEPAQQEVSLDRVAWPPPAWSYAAGAAATPSPTT